MVASYREEEEGGQAIACQGLKGRNICKTIFCQIVYVELVLSDVIFSSWSKNF